jgi:hypothetical protein
MPTRRQGWIEWRSSRARAILLIDLNAGLLSLDENELSAQQAWEKYRHRPEFRAVPFVQFSARLKDHRKQVQEKGSKIEWRNSKAKQIILDDLHDGVLAANDSSTTTADAWEVYRVLPEFYGVQFEQFQEQLTKHRQQIVALKERSEFEEMAMANDQLLHPEAIRNHRGELVFRFTASFELLKVDVGNNRHMAMTTSQLRRSRPEYMADVKSDLIFKDRVYQTIRRAKFVNFLHVKREEKQKERLERRKNMKSCLKTTMDTSE